MAYDSPWARIVGTLVAPAPPDAPTDSLWGRIVSTIGEGTPTDVYGDSDWGRAVGYMGPVVRPMPVVNPLEPGILFSQTAVMAEGAAPSSWSWRQLSGTPVDLIAANNATVTFVTPAAQVDGRPVPANVILGVTAVRGGIASPEAQVIINVLPALSWTWDVVTSTYKGKRQKVFVAP